MGRTGKPKARPFRTRTTEEELRKMDQFEKQMRKYYPKNSRFFYNGSHYQPRCADNFQNPNSLVPQRYKRDFFQSFYADRLKGWRIRVPEPSKIPQNLRILKILAGSEIVLRKLIKQNKGLKHLMIESNDKKINTEVIKHLKYLKGLRSIKLKGDLPLFSEAEWKKIRKNWGKTIEKIDINYNDYIDDSDDSDSVANRIENILQFPKLRKLDLGSDHQFSLYAKLQEKNLPYSASIYLGGDKSLKSLMKDHPQFKLPDSVCVQNAHWIKPSDKLTLEWDKIKKNSKQNLLLWEPDGCPLNLEPVFENVSSLNLIIRGTGDILFRMGQLNNLKHLEIHINGSEEDEERFENLFEDLNNNVACHQKLETFLIKTDVWRQKEGSENLALCFFEACSESLRTVHFEFRYRSANSEEAEYFYQGLSKLKNLKSLSFFLDFQDFKSKNTIEKLCERISEIKSLEELAFKFEKEHHQEALNLKFPSGLKKLSFGMNTSSTVFAASKAIESLSNLLHLEFEFTDFSSAKWSKILHDLTNKLKLLQVLTLKKVQKELSKKEFSQMKERLDKLMKESSSLKLILFASIESKEIMVLRRMNYSWSKINPIIDDLPLSYKLKFSYIQSYAWF